MYLGYPRATRGPLSTVATLQFGEHGRLMIHWSQRSSGNVTVHRPLTRPTDQQGSSLFGILLDFWGIRAISEGCEPAATAIWTLQCHTAE